jgi:hypothetical protein
MRSKQGEDEAWQPREGIASYLDRTSIRSEHRRRQGSEDRISDHISIGMEQEANTGEYAKIWKTDSCLNRPVDFTALWATIRVTRSVLGARSVYQRCMFQKLVLL